MKFLLFFLLACGRGEPLPPSQPTQGLAGARVAALDAFGKTFGSDAALVVDTSQITIESMDKRFECPGVGVVDGCTVQTQNHFYIRVAGNPDTCTFRAVLIHEFLHVYLCQTTVGCDGAHLHWTWGLVWDAQKRVCQ